MSFMRHINEACEHLRSIGIAPEIHDGEAVDDARICEIEKQLQFSLPRELRLYLLEMGDGFQLSYSAEPCTGKEDDQFWWGLDRIEAIMHYWGSMQTDLKLAGNDGGCESDEFRAELERRLRWLPVFGIGGGGYLFCIDYGEGNGTIRYHDIRLRPKHYPSIRLADSLDDWMNRWSRYGFSAPLYDGTEKHAFLESYCGELEGVFDWSPKKFRPIFDRIPQGWST
jgi:SMI1 / KNR4 family (SUKH-1)